MDVFQLQLTRESLCAFIAGFVHQGNVVLGKGDKRRKEAAAAAAAAACIQSVSQSTAIRLIMGDKRNDICLEMPANKSESIIA